MKRSGLLILILSSAISAAEEKYSYTCEAIQAGGVSKINGAWQFGGFERNSYSVTVAHQSLSPTAENQPLSTISFNGEERELRCDLENFSLTFNCLSTLGDLYFSINLGEMSGTFTQAYPPVEGIIEIPLYTALLSCEETQHNN